MSALVELLFRALSVLPLAMLQAFGAALGMATYALSPAYRGKLHNNARLVPCSAAQMRSAARHAGRMLFELPRMWLGAPTPVSWRGQEHIEAALSKGQSILYLTPHMGCFEVTAIALAQRFGSRSPLTVLYRPPRQAWLAPLMLKARNKPHLQAVPTDLSGVKAMLRALKRGESVGLLPDQVPPDGMGVWSTFLGQSAYTMTLAGRLAAQTGAQVITIWAERLSFGRGYALHVAPALDAEALRSTDAQVAANATNAQVEHLLRQCPEQYMWGYARFKKPNSGQEAAQA